MFSAIASCYLLRQTPGSEIVGGLRLTLWRSQTPAIEVKLTDWKDESAITEDVAWMVAAANQGLQDYALHHEVDLAQYHIVLSHFLFHPVDSGATVFYQAAQSALRSALEARSFSRFSPPK
jgi:hypothetical protein